jgi:RND family efflux transporter MFP subunit
MRRTGSDPGRLGDLRTLAPPLVLLVAALGTWWLGHGRAAPEAEPTPPAAPLVRVLDVAPGPLRLTVRAHGTVEPRTESDLVPEVSGRVTWLSPALVAGGFFEADEPLLEIDRRDYENAVRRARAELARAESEVRLSSAELERAKTLAARDITSASALDRQRNAQEVARAARESARSALDQARRDLERTRLLAPFAGRVRHENVDVGQFVTRGAPVARVYAVDFAEVRLPVPDAELAHLDLPLGYRKGRVDESTGPEVILRGRFAGRLHEWPARIVRTEGEIDARSRMLHLVARVADPYGRRDGRPPLAVGLFVEAEIQGRELQDVLRVPRAAVGEDGRILVVDARDRLRVRRAEIVRRDGESAVVRAPLAPGDRLCLSQLPGARDGDPVRPLRADAPLGALSLAGAPR